MGFVTFDDTKTTLSSIRKLLSLKADKSEVKLKADRGDVKQGDFAQNDPGAADYIKNRPCWSAFDRGTIIDGEIVTVSNNGVNSVPLADGDISFDEYEIDFDGRHYYRKLYHDSETSEYFVGNRALRDSDKPDTGEPFLLYMFYITNIFYTKTPGAHSVTFKGETEYIHEIDEKYIPVFQSDWNENNIRERGYIRNRPFYNPIPDKYTFEFKGTSSGTLTYTVDDRIHGFLNLVYASATAKEKDRFKVKIKDHSDTIEATLTAHFDRGYIYMDSVSDGISISGYYQLGRQLEITVDGKAYGSSSLYDVTFIDVLSDEIKRLPQEYVPQDLLHLRNVNISSGANTSVLIGTGIETNNPSYAPQGVVLRKYNTPINSNMPLVVGGGWDDTSRQNVFVVDVNGNGIFKGDVYVKHPQDVCDNTFYPKKLATEELVNTKVSLPTDESNTAINGTVGQYAVSDGNGGVQWSDDIVIKSSTEGSSKKFRLTVDDSGTISATEVV